MDNERHCLEAERDERELRSNSAVERIVMPPERALHYIRWCVEAYGCPAPPEEVVELLKNKYAMDDQEADELITGLVARGDIKFIKQQYLTDGFVPVEGA